MANEATAEKLPIDDRCKHGMIPRTCAYCLGYAPSKYGASVGLAWIHSTGFTQKSFEGSSPSSYYEE